MSAECNSFFHKINPQIFCSSEGGGGVYKFKQGSMDSAVNIILS